MMCIFEHTGKRGKKGSITPTSTKILIFIYHEIIYEHIKYIIDEKNKEKEDNEKIFLIFCVRLHMQTTNWHWTISKQNIFVSKIIYNLQDL